MASTPAARYADDGGREPANSAGAAAAFNVYSLRRAGPDDVPTLIDIEREAFPSLTAPTPYQREVRRETALYLLGVRPMGRAEVEDRRRAGADPRGVFRRLRDALLLERRPGGARPVHEHAGGAVGLWFVLDECHIVTIATRMVDRRKGVGELLLIGAVQASLMRGSRVITLEVRASNEAARALYRKYGFQDVGMRRRYYTDNQEDAVIMTTPPIQSSDYQSHFETLVKAHETRWGMSARNVE